MGKRRPARRRFRWGQKGAAQHASTRQLPIIATKRKNPDEATIFTLTEPISTDRLVLRRYEAGDVDDVHAILSRPDVVQYLYWEVQTRDRVAEVLQRYGGDISLENDNDALRLAITWPGAEGTQTGVIGEAVLWLRSVEHRQGEIGYLLHPAFGGQGFAREAASALLDLAFSRLRLHRVYGRTDARNAASANLMRKLGMRQEAHFIGNEWFKGAWGDELVFAILEDEWRAGTSTRRQ
jgi:RimJ/RimL family protein N-acetyltransferase